MFRRLLVVGSSLDRRIAEVAERQYGYFRLSQCDAIGLTSDHRDARTRAGRWVVRYDRVYRIAGVAPSWRGELLAACWAAPGEAHASHRAAAGLRDLPGGSHGLVEITCHRWRRARVAGIVVHESKKLDPGDIETVQGIPTASVEQTLLGLAAVVHETIVEMALDRALHREQTTVDRLAGFIRRKGKQGRDGVGVLRALVEDRDPGAGVPESPMETMLKQLLRDRGFPTPEFQYEIWHDGRFIARVDAAYPEQRIAIEYDSYAHHTGKQAIDRDNERRARLSRIDWDMIAFTASALRNGGGEQLETLRALFGARGGFGVTPP